MAKSTSPFLMFQNGDAEEAMNFYASLFAGSSIASIERFGSEGPGKAGSVMAGSLNLNGRTVMFFDSPMKHAFTFTPAISLFVECESPQEVDKLFSALSENGQVLMPLNEYPFAKRFGWVNDRFGVSWQLRFN